MQGNSKRTSVAVTGNDGSKAAALHEIRSDAPNLPVADFERLHAFRPDIVDQAMVLTRDEAEFRRKELVRSNTLGWIHNMTALLIPGVTVIGYLLICAYLILHNHEQSGVGLLGGGVVLAGIIAAFKKQ